MVTVVTRAGILVSGQNPAIVTSHYSTESCAWPPTQRFTVDYLFIKLCASRNKAALSVGVVLAGQRGVEQTENYVAQA